MAEDPIARPLKLVHPGRLRSIDALRGIAALAVVGGHAALNDAPPPGVGFIADFSHGLRWFLSLGRLGVPLFFVISGFCIHLPWARRRSIDVAYDTNWRAFWKRRFLRLYPPYLIILCLTMAMVAIGVWQNSAAPIVRAYPADHRVAWVIGDFFAHASMLHGLHPVFNNAGGNGVYWTLAREEYLYALYLPFLWSRKHWGIGTSFFAVAIFGLLFTGLLDLFIPSTSPWRVVVDSSAIALWIQWILGAVAAEAVFGGVTLPAWTRSMLLVPTWAILAGIAGSQAPLFEPLLMGMAFFTLLNAAVHREIAGRWFSARLVGWLSAVGVFSYSLYLVHNPARMVLKQIVGPMNTWPTVWLMAAITAIIGYFTARIYFWAIESRFLRRPASSRRDIHIGLQVEQLSA